VKVTVSATSRPFTRLVVAGNAAHAFVELVGGAGMPGASVAGVGPAAATFTAGSGWLWRAAGQGERRHDAPLAAYAALSLAAVTAHLSAWPRRSTRLGVPWLTECEGLGPEVMPVYNPVLYVTAAAAAVALLREVRSASPAVALALCLVPGLQVLQHREHERLVEQARKRPRWWNRRLTSL
jgi:hypothetical protein